MHGNINIKSKGFKYILKSVVMDNLSDKIQDYIDGQLEGNDLLQFEAQLAVDKDLYNLLTLQKEVHDILEKRVVNKEMELRATINTVSNNFRHNPSTKVVELRKIIYYAVAVCALIVGSVFFFNRSNNLYDLPLMSSEIVRGHEESVSYETAVKLFNNKDYMTARIQLESLLGQQEIGQVQLEYYIGLTFIGEKNWQSAIQELEPIALGHSVFAEEAKCYLAIAYLEKGDSEKAKQLLNELSAEGDLGEKAKSLLKKIN